MDTNKHRFAVEVTPGLETPATLEFNGDLDDCHEAVVIGPGWSEPKIALSALRRNLVEQGHAAITFDQPRVKVLSSFGNAGELRARTIAAVIEEAEQFGLERFALTGHSLGGIDVTRASEMVGDKLSRLTLLASAGLIEGDRFSNVAARLARGLAVEACRPTPSNIQTALRVGRHVLRNPLQLALEGVYGGTTDIRDRVKTLVDNGLPVDTLQLGRDIVFPHERVTSSIQELEVNNVVTLHPKHACHTSPSHDPRRTAEALSDMLLDLDVRGA